MRRWRGLTSGITLRSVCHTDSDSEQNQQALREPVRDDAEGVEKESPGCNPRVRLALSHGSTPKELDSDLLPNKVSPLSGV